MRYVEIDGVRVDVKDCESCPLNYDGQNCRHPTDQSVIVDYDWLSGVAFPSMCPLREVEE